MTCKSVTTSVIRRFVNLTSITCIRYSYFTRWLSINMTLVKSTIRYLLSSIGLFIVIWPIISLLFVSAVGISILSLNVGPSTIEPIMNQVWPNVVTGISVIIVLLAAFVFVRRSCSLRRLGFFTLSAYSFTLVFGLILSSVLGGFFNTGGQSPNTSNAANLTVDFVFSLFVFFIGYLIAYILFYRNGYNRIRSTVTTASDH
jgi:hypothetical protein